MPPLWSPNSCRGLTHSPSPFSLIPNSSLKPFLSLSLSAAATTLDQTFYGPSLHKGHKFSLLKSLHKQQQQQQQQVEDDCLIDTDNFTRVFEITALRVPSEHYFALESRLRGHLLTWPRVRNIVGVPGNEIVEDFKKLFVNQPELSSDDEDERLVSLDRIIYVKAHEDGELLSPVMYRYKLARTFNLWHSHIILPPRLCSRSKNM